MLLLLVPRLVIPPTGSSHSKIRPHWFVRPEVNSIRPSAVGCKLANIYDINSKVYLLKLQRKGRSHS